jgi:hypothetical protein
MGDQVREKDAELATIQNEHREMRVRAVSMVEARLKGLKDQLDGIHNSRGWALLMIYYRCRDSALPPGSRRRAFVRWLFRGALALPGWLLATGIATGRRKECSREAR